MVVLWHLEQNPSRIKLKNRFPHVCAVCKTQENSERGSGLEANPRPVKMTWDPKLTLMNQNHTTKGQPDAQNMSKVHPRGNVEGGRAGCF